MTLTRSITAMQRLTRAGGHLSTERARQITRAWLSGRAELSELLELYDMPISDTSLAARKRLVARIFNYGTVVHLGHQEGTGLRIEHVPIPGQPEVETITFIGPRLTIACPARMTGLVRETTA